MEPAFHLISLCELFCISSCYCNDTYHEALMTWPTSGSTGSLTSILQNYKLRKPFSLIKCSALDISLQQKDCYARTEPWPFIYTVDVCLLQQCNGELVDGESSKAQNSYCLAWEKKFAILFSNLNA